MIAILTLHLIKCKKIREMKSCKGEERRFYVGRLLSFRGNRVPAINSFIKKRLRERGMANS